MPPWYRERPVFIHWRSLWLGPYMDTHICPSWSLNRLCRVKFLALLNLSNGCALQSSTFGKREGMWLSSAKRNVYCFLPLCCLWPTVSVNASCRGQLFSSSDVKITEKHFCWVWKCASGKGACHLAQRHKGHMEGVPSVGSGDLTTCRATCWFTVKCDEDIAERLSFHWWSYGNGYPRIWQLNINFYY